MTLRELAESDEMVCSLLQPRCKTEWTREDKARIAVKLLEVLGSFSKVSEALGGYPTARTLRRWASVKL